MKSLNRNTENDKALVKFAEQFKLDAEEDEAVKQLQTQHKLQQKGGRFFFRPLKFLLN